MNNVDDHLYNELYKICDTVISVEEIDEEQIYREDCFKVTMAHVKSFFEQVDKKLNSCQTEQEIIFTKESTLNFIIFSLKKMIVEYDFPDDNIEFLADHLKEQILKVKRKKL